MEGLVEIIFSVPASTQAVIPEEISSIENDQEREFAINEWARSIITQMKDIDVISNINLQYKLKRALYSIQEI